MLLSGMPTCDGIVTVVLNMRRIPPAGSFAGRSSASITTLLLNPLKLLRVTVLLFAMSSTSLPIAGDGQVLSVDVPCEGFVYEGRARTERTYLSVTSVFTGTRSWLYVREG